jgi:hypothetical protein
MRALLVAGFLVTLAAGLSAGSQGKAVDHTALATFLPAITGWEKGEVDGDQGEALGMSYSSTSVEYTKGDINVRLEIIDTIRIASLTMPFSMAAGGMANEKNAEGYRLGITIAGHAGWEEWQIQEETGEVSLLVAGRFIVRATGAGLPNISPVKEIINAVPFAKLAAMK